MSHNVGAGRIGGKRSLRWEGRKGDLPVRSQIVLAQWTVVSPAAGLDDRLPPMLPVIRAAAVWIESRARCAYRAVVWT